MRYNPLSSSLYIKNRKKLREQLPANSLVIVHSNDEMPKNGDQTFTFRQNSTLFYLSGLDQEQCILTICPDHPNEQLREVAFTVQTNDLMVKWNGYKYTKEDVKQLSGVKTVKWLEDFEMTLRELMLFSENVYLHQNDYPKFTTEVKCKEDRFALELKQKYPLHEYNRLAPITNALRMVKEKEEIAQIKKACNITRDGFLRALKFVEPGVKEYEIEAEFTHEFIRQGANGHAYAPIVASGKNACVLHYCTNDNVCQSGDLLLFDIGADYGNYAADMSRTIPVNGKFTKRQKQVYEAVLRILKAGTKLLKPGSSINKWHSEICKLMEKELLGLGLISEIDIKNQNPESPAYFKYYMHGSGHFLGLDVHDSGNKHDIFKKGMIMTCEPGIYIDDEGIGIRLENDILIDEKPINLMADIPIEIEEIEKLMKRR